MKSKHPPISLCDQKYTVLVYTHFFCWNLTWFTIIGHLQWTTQMLFERSQKTIFQITVKAEKTVAMKFAYMVLYALQLKWSGITSSSLMQCLCMLFSFCFEICIYGLICITVKIKWDHKFKFNVVSIYVIQFLLLRQSVTSNIDQCADDKIYKTGIFRSIVICLSSI
jgi:hypothetical protein